MASINVGGPSINLRDEDLDQILTKYRAGEFNPGEDPLETAARAVWNASKAATGREPVSFDISRYAIQDFLKGNPQTMYAPGSLSGPGNNVVTGNSTMPAAPTKTPSAPDPNMIEISPGQFVNKQFATPGALAQAKSFNPNQPGLQNVYLGGQTLPILPQATPPSNAGAINNVPGSPNMPVVSPYFGNPTGAVAATSGSEKLIEILQQQMKDTQAQQEKQIAQQQEQTKGFLSTLMNSKSAAETRDDTFNQIGINPQQYFAEEQAKIAEIGTLTEEYNAVKAMKDQAIAQSYDKLATNSFINNQIAQIERNAAPRLNQLSANINSKAAVLQALQGRFAEARSFVEQAVQDATADKKYQFDLFTTFYQINQDSINRLDTKYQNALNQALDVAKTQWQLDVQDKRSVAELMISNPQAGISITDSLGMASAKISSNPKAEKPNVFGTADGGYYQQTYNPTTNTYQNTQITNPSPNTGPAKFTSTQLNDGASKAGLARTEFDNLPYDVKNYYVNSSSKEISAVTDTFNGIKTGKTTLAKVKEQINQSNTPQPVKDHLIQRASAIIPPVSTVGLWQKITNFFGF